MNYSWFSSPSPEITSDGISAEMSDTGRYVVQLGSRQGDPNAARLYLAPEIARKLIESVHEALVANGDAEPMADVGLARQAAADAEAHQWDIVNGGGADGDQPEIAGVTVISAERLAELRKQLAAEKRAAGAGDAL